MIKLGNHIDKINELVQKAIDNCYVDTSIVLDTLHEIQKLLGEL